MASIEDFEPVNIRDADLSYADLKEADLRGTVLFSANLSGANLIGVKWDEETQWPEGIRGIMPLIKGES